MVSFFLTKKVVYVVKALYYLEVVRHNQMTSVVEIATATDIPKRFLEQLFLRLRQPQIVQSVRGAQGGYRLTRGLAEISLYDLLAALNDRTPRAVVAEGRYGEDLFVSKLAESLEESTRTLYLGELITPAMLSRAETTDQPHYIYQI